MMSTRSAEPNPQISMTIVYQNDSIKKRTTVYIYMYIMREMKRCEDYAQQRFMFVALEITVF